MEEKRLSKFGIALNILLLISIIIYFIHSINCIFLIPLITFTISLLLSVTIDHLNKCQLINSHAFAYKTLICCFSILLCIGILINNANNCNATKCPFAEAMTNLGYGILASFIVSLMIDLGQSRYKRERDKLHFDVLIKSLNNECLGFFDAVCNTLNGHIDYPKKEYSLQSLIDEIMVSRSSKYELGKLDFCKALEAKIRVLKTKAEEFQIAMVIHIDNSYFDKDILEHAKNITNGCDRFFAEYAHYLYTRQLVGNSANSKELNDAVKDLSSAIIAFNPEAGTNTKTTGVDTCKIPKAIAYEV